MSIAHNLNLVRQQITEACRQAGRDPASVRLVAVSKTHPADLVRQALDAGQTLFGESYIQEAQEKIPALGPGPAWHFIGHLQSNKARLAAQLFSCIETIHSLKLAQALSRHAGELDKTLDVAVQVSLAGEAQKSGCLEPEAAPLCQAVAALPSLRLVGLMTMPPYSTDPEDSRPVFAQLRALAARLAPNLPPGSMSQLSMGMSHDFPVAIAEGATLVRVGTAIFGER